MEIWKKSSVLSKYLFISNLVRELGVPTFFSAVLFGSGYFYLLKVNELAKQDEEDETEKLINEFNDTSSGSDSDDQQKQEDDDLHPEPPAQRPRPWTFWPLY